MEIEVLQSLGFTQAEASVYLTLLEIGPEKVGKIIEKTGLQSSTIHNNLHFLIDRGFINYVLRGKTKIYQAADPKLILMEFKEREKELEKLIPKLETRFLLKEKQQAEIYEGLNGVKIMLNEFIDDTKPDDVFYFFAVDVSGLNKEIQEFFEAYDIKRKSKKLIVKGLARRELKTLFTKRKYLKMRYVDFPIPANVSMCNNKLVLINWGDKPTGILINSKQLVENHVIFFEELWNKAGR